MKKIIIYLILILSLLCAFSVPAFSAMQNDEIQSRTEAEIFDIIDEDTSAVLKKAGIDGLDYSKIYTASFSAIKDYFSQNLKEKLSDAIRCLMLLSGVLMITAAVRLFAGANAGSYGFELVCLMAVSMLTVGKLSPVINTVLSVLNVSAKFMLGYIPIFAGIVALSGNPASALTYNTLTLAFAEGISAFSNNLAVSVIGGFYCLSISFSVGKGINLSRFVSAFSKLSSVVLGLIASLFTGLISIKGIMASGVDSVSAKGIRFVLSSMIPVVGSAISEAYGAIVGSLGLIKGSVAVVGIAASLIINIPAIVQALLYYMVLSIVSFFAEASGMNDLAGIYKAFSVGIKFLLLTEIYEMFILIISTGLMLTLK